MSETSYLFHANHANQSRKEFHFFTPTPDSAQGGKASPNSPVGPCKKQHSEVELAEIVFVFVVLLVVVVVVGGGGGGVAVVVVVVFV